MGTKDVAGGAAPKRRRAPGADECRMRSATGTAAGRRGGHYIR